MSSDLSKIQATSAKEWRKLRKEGFPYRFLSGFIGIIRPVSLVDLFSMGEIPEHLIQLAYSMTTGSKDQENKEVSVEDAKKAMQRLKELLAVIAKSAFISPTVVANEDEITDDNTITASDLTFEDSMELLVAVQYPATALARFRQEQTESV